MGRPFPNYHDPFALPSAIAKRRGDALLPAAVGCSDMIGGLILFSTFAMMRRA
jgi:hypothetical protein